MSVETRDAGARAEAVAVAATDAVVGTEAGAECANCGGPLVGDFCHACGEKRADRRDLSVRHFVAEAAQEFTSLEHSKVFRTLKALVLKPGLLTREYFAGRRGRYLKPLNLFLGLFALNLFAYSFQGASGSRDAAFLLKTDKDGSVAQLFDKWAAKRNTTREAIIQRTSEKWRDYGGRTWLQVLNAVLFALLLQIVYVFSKRYFVEHLVFSIHFTSFTLLLSALAWPFYFWASDPSGPNVLVGFGLMLVTAVYLFFAVRAFYERRAVKNVLRSLVLIAGYWTITTVAYLATLIAAIVVTAKY